MELLKILEKDLEGKGVLGQPEVPGLSAFEMQRKVEEIVRDVAIVKINEIIAYLMEDGATKEDLEKLLIKAGAVSSVFGRAGDIVPMKGDYTCDMVGAAREKHSAEHFTGGNDPIAPEKIGAAEKEHIHGNIDSGGCIGSTNGKIIMTGVGGKLVAKDKSESGFCERAKVFSTTGAVSFTAEDNAEYDYKDVTSFRMNGAPVECHGFVTFGNITSAPVITGFYYSGDDITEAASMETWEFSVFEHGGKPFAIFKNWGVVL